jgi:hypothetical protein
VDGATAITGGVLTQVGKATPRINSNGVINGYPIKTLSGARVSSAAEQVGIFGKIFLPLSIFVGTIDAIDVGIQTGDIRQGIVRFVKNSVVNGIGYGATVAAVSFFEGCAIFGTGGGATPLAIAGGVAAGSVIQYGVGEGFTLAENYIFGR